MYITKTRRAVYMTTCVVSYERYVHRTLPSGHHLLEITPSYE